MSEFTRNCLKLASCNKPIVILLSPCVVLLIFQENENTIRKKFGCMYINKQRKLQKL